MLHGQEGRYAILYLDTEKFTVSGLKDSQLPYVLKFLKTNEKNYSSQVGLFLPISRQ